MAKIGRPLDSVKHRFAEILEKSNAHERFRQILQKTEKDEVFLKAYELANDRAFGKSTQSIDVNDVTEQRPDRIRLEESIRSIESIISRIGLDKKE